MLAEPAISEGTAPSSPGSDGPGALAARVFVSDQGSETVIRESLAALGVQGAQFTAGDVTAAIAALAKESSPQLLIVDISGIGDPLTKLRDLANVCGPNISVIVIGERNDIAFYRELKSMGTSEYLLKPLVRSLLTGACKAILAPQGHHSDSRTGRLVFVLGVRGGVGATTIATNLSWCMAETKRRHTAFVDLDLQKGDAALQLDAKPSHALCEALEQPDRVDRLFLERGMGQITGRLDLLASLEPLSSPLPFTEEAFLWLLDKLLPRYRLTIVEVPPDTAVRLTWALGMPSTCLLVSNPSLAGARDMARWSGLLGPDTPERSTLHILNHCTPHGGLADADFARALGKAPDAIIPYDREMAEAATLGIKAMQKCAAFQRGLSGIVRDFTGEPVEKKGSLFSRMFSS
ncbi:MAG: response regulator receiver protein [Rhodomicrobium sp.]